VQWRLTDLSALGIDVSVTSCEKSFCFSNIASAYRLDKRLFGWREAFVGTSVRRAAN